MMRFKGAGRALMATGVVCIIFYILTALSDLSATVLRVGKVLFYVGIVALILGVVVRLLRQSPLS
jgi:hypothetical protein